MENIKALKSYFSLLVEVFLKERYASSKASVYSEKFHNLFIGLIESPINQPFFSSPTANLHAVNPLFVIALYKTLESEKIPMDEFTDLVMDVYKIMVKPLLKKQRKSIQNVKDPWLHFIKHTKEGNHKLYDNKYFQMKYAVEDRLRFGFDINRCYYYDIFKENDAIKLAPVMCKYDNLLADNLQEYVRFQRNSTIADGNSNCSFRYFKNI
ncbi:MAG: L-2-amino-thiazoline-4-carboxylic acid hydrolase [Promethearchaeota archaeon]